METQMSVVFSPFRLDLSSEQLWREDEAIALRPKTFAVLQHLAEHAGELVGKQALLDAVWGDVAVSEDVARQSVRELREALADERGRPRFVETVPRRGYRFTPDRGAVAGAETLGPTGVASRDSRFVGRSAERVENTPRNGFAGLSRG